MLKTLGFAKKRPASEGQIRKHREQLRQFSQWKDDLNRINSIVAKLNNAYRSHKGDFALGRYDELKQMIKDAIKEYHDLMEKTQKHARDSATSAMANKYSGNHSDPAPAPAPAPAPPPTAGDPIATMGAIFNKIKLKAAELGISSAPPPPQQTAAPPMSKEERKDKEMETWGYEGRKAKDVEEETESMRKEVIQMKADFRTHRDRLEALAKEYEDSKKHSPPQRYMLLKNMIKDAVGA